MPGRRDSLPAQAHDFAERTTNLLNRTVTDGIRVTAALREDNQVGWIGYGIGRRELFPGRGIPLTITGPPVHCYLHVLHTLVQAHGKLVTDESSFGLYLDQDLEHNVFHYDYARHPGNPYPIAHVQVNAISTAFNQLCTRLGRPAEFPRLHLPVGGKRFRPCLEDLVEALIVEGLAAPRPSWEAVVAEHRTWFHRIQLKAAVRDDPDAAREELDRLEEEQRQEQWPRRGLTRRRRQR